MLVTGSHIDIFHLSERKRIDEQRQHQPSTFNRKPCYTIIPFREAPKNTMTSIDTDTTVPISHPRLLRGSDREKTSFSKSDRVMSKSSDSIPDETDTSCSTVDSKEDLCTKSLSFGHSDHDLPPKVPERCGGGKPETTEVALRRRVCPTENEKWCPRERQAGGDSSTSRLKTPETRDEAVQMKQAHSTRAPRSSRVAKLRAHEKTRSKTIAAAKTSTSETTKTEAKTEVHQHRLLETKTKRPKKKADALPVLRDVDEGELQRLDPRRRREHQTNQAIKKTPLRPSLVQDGPFRLMIFLGPSWWNYGRPTKEERDDCRIIHFA
jgi:hypothetical protein